MGSCWGLRTKNDGLPSCESKRKGIKGLSGRCRVSNIILGCGKELQKCKQLGDRIVTKEANIKTMLGVSQRKGWEVQG